MRTLAARASLSSTRRAVGRHFVQRWSQRWSPAGESRATAAWSPAKATPPYRQPARPLRRRALASANRHVRAKSGLLPLDGTAPTLRLAAASTLHIRVPKPARPAYARRRGTGSLPQETRP